jgi:hypothetical protein
MLGSSDQGASYNVSVKELCIYNGYKELLWPFLGDLFDVLARSTYKYTQNSIGTKNRRRGSAGGNTSSTSPSTQETKNRPNQVESNRGRLKVARDPERENINHSADQ